MGVERARCTVRRVRGGGSGFATSLRRLALSALLGVIGACASAPLHQADGYAVRASYPLTPPRDRMRGRIELLEDARIDPSMRTAIAESYGADPCAGHPPDVLNALCDPHHLPLRPAMLRLVDTSGRVVATRPLERPLADLGVASLYGTERRSYMLTVDLSAGFGSYSGPYTRFAEPDARGFGWVTADSAGVTDTLTLVSTLKMAWRLVSDGRGHSADLLLVRCRPDFSVTDSAAFTLTFEHYTFDGARWRLLARREPGCYESDEPFPPRSKFP